MSRFADRNALVTGAGSGLGRATAIRLASEGARVALLDLDVGAATEVVDKIVADGGTAVALECNVANEESVTAAVAAAVDGLGSLHVVVNSAGVLRMSHTTETTMAEWNLVVGVNLTGTFLVCREALPHLVASGGTIVNVASSAGIRGHAYAAAYCASKGGVIQLTKQLAEEFKASGVTANAICPGGMATPMVHNLQIPDDINMDLLFKHASPKGECTPEEVAGVIAFLASDEAGYMTGAVVSVDGGITV